MCATCGCRKPRVQHQDARHITVTTFYNSAFAAGVPPDLAYENLGRALQEDAPLRAFLSEVSRPRIVCDIDGTLAQRDQAALAAINAKFNTQYRYTDMKSTAGEWIDDPEARDWYEKHKHDPVFLVDLGVYEDARWAVWSLRSGGYHLTIASDREDSLLSTSKTWLNEQEIEYDDIHVGKDEKLKIAQAASPDEPVVFLDDNPKRTEDLPGPGRTVLLLDRPWNQGVKESDRVKRVFTWDEVMTILPAQSVEVVNLSAATKAVMPEITKAVDWNEDMHPRDEHGQFSTGGGNALGRQAVDHVLEGKTKGSDIRSTQTHMKVISMLKASGLHEHAAEYQKILQEAKQKGTSVHPRNVYSRANANIHEKQTGQHIKGWTVDSQVKPPKQQPATTVGPIGQQIPPGIGQKPAVGPPTPQPAVGLPTHTPAQVAAPAPVEPQFKTVTEQVFKESSDAKATLRNEGTAFISKLSASEKSAIRTYTGNWYGSINPNLREGILPAGEKARVLALDSALSKTQTSENVIVGRSIGDKVINKIRQAGVGGTFKDAAFVSTRAEPHSYGNVKIEIPKGSPGLYVNSISQHQGEDEFLLPRESEFEVIKVGSQAQDFTIRYLGSHKAEAGVSEARANASVVSETKQVPISPSASSYYAPLYQSTPTASGYVPTVAPGKFEAAVYGAIKIDGPKGSQPGQWYKLPGGQEVYAKPMSAERAYNEVGAARAYAAMGAKPGEDIPTTYVSKDVNGQYYVLSTKIDGLQPLTAEQWKNSYADEGAQAQKLWAADVVLSHWDVAGLAHDNLVGNPGVGTESAVARVDMGGAMKYRAQGTVKDNWKPGGAGWVEPWTMRGLQPPGGGAKVGVQTGNVFGHMTNTEAANALEGLRLHMSQGGMAELKQSWKALGMSAQDMAFNEAVIQGRLDSIPTISQTLMTNPTAAAQA